MGPRNIFKWILILTLVAAAVGTASALFIWSLDFVTRARFSASWLVFLLPVAGAGMGFYYRHHGKHVQSGNRAILSSVHKKKSPLPHSLAPSILLATLATHLFGGSAGREGTAVQLGAGLASTCGGRFISSKKGTELLIFCGIAAGFGAVFATPFAGAIFALEFARRKLISPILIPCALTALAANHICHLWGASHTIYPSISFEIDGATLPYLFLKIIAVAVIFALACRLFISASEFATKVFTSLFKHEALRAAVGGCLIIGLLFLAGTSDYLGLGTLAQSESSLTLPRFFSPEIQAPATAWLWKLAFTIITLSAGFKGGEVTPLFFIGAALGNTLAWLFSAPVDLFAAMGMIAFFAAATKTPIASFVMGLELLGLPVAIPLALATFITTKLSGKQSVYPDIKDL